MADMQERSARAGHLRRYLELAATLAVIAASVVVTTLAILNYRDRAAVQRLGAQQANPQPPKELQSLNDANMIGSHSAQVAVIQFSDFECPYCARFAQDTWPALKQQYISSGKVVMAFRHFPLSMHARAKPAAAAAECAGRQGKFWEMHDRLFQNPRSLDDRRLHSLATDLGLDGQSFLTCLGGDVHGRVQADLNSARNLSINSTPTFLLGRVESTGKVRVTQVLEGAQPLRAFQTALDELLAR